MRTLLCLSLIVGTLFIAAAPVTAQEGSLTSVYGEALEQQSAQVAGGLVTCSGLDCDFCRLGEMVNGIINWLFGFLIVVAVLVFAYAGWRLVTESGSAEARTYAKQRFTYVVLGLLLMLASWLIIDTIMRGLTGQGLSVWSRFEVNECGGMTQPRARSYVEFDLASFGYSSAEELRADEIAGAAGAGTLRNFQTPGGSVPVRACDESQLTSVTAFGHTFLTNQAMVPMINRVDRQWEAAGGTDFYNIDQVSSYHCRNKRGSDSLSNHAFGMAIDFNWSGGRNYGANADGSPVTDMPDEFVEMWRNQGAHWGGGWCSLRDAMHFSYGSEERERCGN